MRTLAPIAFALALSFQPAFADDVEESISAALEAYRAGDIKAAKEEIDFVSQLLGQLQAEGLSGFLPQAFEGWERELDETQSMAAFGGGQMASATYRKDGKSVEIQLMAGNQMVTAMSAMFSNPVMMGSMGKVKRLNRQKVVITPQGEVNTLINQVMVQISGSADVADKEAYFETLDVKALEQF